MKYFVYILIAFSSFVTEAQQTDYVDFKTAKANLRVNPLVKGIGGHIIYTFDVLKDVDSIYVDAIGFRQIEFKLDEGPIRHDYDGKRIKVKHPFKKGDSHSLLIGYYTQPKKAMYFIGWEDEKENNQVWSQGQGKYTSNWLPSFDDMNEKVIFEFVYNVDDEFEVVANGSRAAVSLDGQIRKEHTFNMQKPMSSYLVALAIGKYNKKKLASKSGIPIELYYYPEDSAKVEPTYRYTKQLFDFLEEEIGVPYPWQNYKQVPVKDFLYSGMENTSLTIFSDDFMIDEMSFVDKNYVNVNAHELAHQWFGDLVTETKGKHHWLQEGFATYYALLAERAVFGDDYYYWRLYEYAQELLAQEKVGQATILLDPKASSATFYKKGAWTLHMLKEQVGEAAFKQAVKNYLEKFQFKNVETKDFITEVEKASGRDLTAFQEKWFLSKTLAYNEMVAHLTSVSNAVRGYLEIDCEVYSTKCSEYLTSYIFDESKIKVIEQMPNKIKPEDFKNNIKVRQAIVQNLTEIPSVLKADYETLLNDKSYITIEAALYNLWANFPQDRKQYLDKTKEIQGFNDKNIRTLWLVLALNTEGYNEANKLDYYQELVDYTLPKYGFQLRQNAFSYLNSINGINETVLVNLVDASRHHNWRFKSFVKKMLERLKENEKYKEIITNLQAKQKKKF